MINNTLDCDAIRDEDESTMRFDSNWCFEGAMTRQFTAYFQPIVCLATGKVAGYEALAREIDSVSGRVNTPLAFFDPKISLSQKREWDRTVREAAFNQFSKMPNSSTFLTVNIFPDWIDLLESEVVPSLEMIKRSGLDPKNIIMEITERDGDLENLKRLVSCYQAFGMRVAIDDFGVGASQVDRVIALQPDIIKLDMNLFKSASAGLPEADVFLAVASIAQRAGCEIICEGVETEDELHFAIECGANYVQGWIFDKALPHAVATGSYEQQLRIYKKSYLERKAGRYYDLAQRSALVVEQVETLSRHYSDYQSGALNCADLDGAGLSACGIFRIYICDDHGSQISANLDVCEGVVRCSEDSSQYNWSHRPYFPLLHAVNDMGAQRVISSDPYKDIITGTMCRTYGCFISKDRVLLVDAFVDDEVLFRRES